VDALQPIPQNTLITDPDAFPKAQQPRMPRESSVQQFSTRSIPKSMRFDYWLNVMRESLWPVTDWRDVPEDFGVELDRAQLGCLSAMAEKISAHHSRRTVQDVGRSAESSYHLFLTLGADWAFTHNGYHERLEAGDVVMMGEGVHETNAPEGFTGILLKCPEHWVKTWLPDPRAICGRVIRSNAGWGRVLSPMLSQLTPEFVTSASLPDAVLVDQVGATLAFVAGAVDARSTSDLLGPVLYCIRERCDAPGLSAADVASSLSISPRVLHKALASAKTTFASELLRARLDVALSLLSAAPPQRTLAEISRLAGFANPSHFARVVRQHTGHTPHALRARQA